ncbi:MAG: helix-turn-helix domain-containing protein [Pirellulaceae bacterium]|nr:helix-turn-helix domain-containing protein [Pirellulaceae bacterium]
MTTESKRRPLAERLKAGLSEAIGFAQGELTLRTVQAPTPPPAMHGKEVTRLRAKAGMSQAVFAKVLNVSTKTVQSWEQGDRKPSHAALRMLQLFRENPRFVIETAGVSSKAADQRSAQRKTAVSSR